MYREGQRKLYKVGTDVSTGFVVANSAGDALDAVAPDPAEDVPFEVTFVGYVIVNPE
jgi:hypothetical protein